MKPREFFPNMPSEVFDSWIAPLISGKGWPFKSIEDDLQSTSWRFVLGLDHTLKQWHECEWELITINLAEAKFTNGSMDMFKAIIGNAAYGVPTETADIENTVNRFRACTAYIQKHGNIPLPIIVTNINGGYFVMDGNHRMAAVAHHNPPSNLGIPAWLANINLTKISRRRDKAAHLI